MRKIVATMGLGFLLAVGTFGCDGGEEVVTDPAKLKPLSEDQKKALRAADDQVAEEETALRTLPTKAGKKAAK